MTSSPKELTYFFVGKGGPPSLDPESADIIRNMVHMDHLVGTLLKERYGNTGRTEPYIAEHWDSSPDQLTWNFYLKSGLKCEDGTPIDAPAFVDSFNRILPIYAKRDDLAAFSRLDGWQEMKTKGAPIKGIHALSEKHLQLRFDSAPDGLLEFLTMSFYGFYCKANFENGRWKDIKKIVSSGPYSLEPGSLSETGLTLRKRSDFPLLKSDAPDRIFIRTIEANEAPSSSSRTIMYYRQNDGGQRPEGYELYQGAPIFLTALVLSPHRKTAFDRIENRRTFQNAVREAVTEIPKPSVGSSKFYLGSEFYFPDQEQIKAISKHTSKPDWHPNAPLKVLRLSYSANQQSKYVEQIVTKALDNLDWPYEITDPKFDDPDFIKKRNTNREYDIRLATVDIGGTAENWVINMMFCSQLAISFPDPSGRICELVKRSIRLI
jgi:ABC-type transport system substrate-binding protein